MKDRDRDITLDVFKNAIVLSRGFAKKVKNIGSAEYAELMKVRKANPDFEVVVHKPNKKPKSYREHYSGLNLEYIREYIQKYDNTKAAFDEFEKIVFIAKCHDYKFGHVRKWFLEKYPEVKEIFQEKAAEAAAKAAAEAAAKADTANALGNAA